MSDPSLELSRLLHIHGDNDVVLPALIAAVSLEPVELRMHDDNTILKLIYKPTSTPAACSPIPWNNIASRLEDHTALRSLSVAPALPRIVRMLPMLSHKIKYEVYAFIDFEYDNQLLVRLCKVSASRGCENTAAQQRPVGKYVRINMNTFHDKMVVLHNNHNTVHTLILVSGLPLAMFVGLMWVLGMPLLMLCLCSVFGLCTLVALYRCC